MGRLENKIAIIVGSTSGIGAASAKLFAKEGATVIVTGRKTELGEKVAAEIVAQGGKAEYMHLDVNDFEEHRAVLAKTVEKYGKLDIFFYNAGISGNHDAETVTPEYWDRNMNTDLKSLFFMTQAALPYLKESKGNILYTCSTAGISGHCAGTGVAYGPFKAGVELLTRQLSVLWTREYGIRVNAIAPGVTMTPILDGLPEDIMTWLKADTPVGFIADPIDQAYAALFLASDEARFITGQVLAVCGGASIR